ncbi:MAG: LacI family DNA-binding transcriptional regulator [Clostridia bacterium]|nr:LacI family DNA-binding transcriptional regulator [Clostridia bacterium]
MPTIKDIAARAGVSPTTVSNVLHNKYQRVSPETVVRIRETIARMGYVPNMSARALASSSSRIVGVVNHLVPLESGGFFQDPFHSVLLSGIEQTLRQYGYFLMARTIDSAEELHSLLTNWNIDGLIITGIFPRDLYQSLRRQEKPFVLIDSYIDDDHSIQIRLEDRQGGYIATRHLLQKGHRSILFCCPKMEEDGVIRERYLGYTQALEEFGVPVRPENICESSFTIEDGIALGRRLSQRDDFTAIFATADILAAELSTGLQLSGRRVPQDVSIVGFDDTNQSRINCPPLTTVHQDVVGRGALAVELLINAMEKNEYAPPRIFPVSLTERDSVRDLNP